MKITEAINNSVYPNKGTMSTANTQVTSKLPLLSITVFRL
jgi:hypothetical protein